MRNLLMLCAFMMVAGFASAQQCSKSKAACAKTCTKGKAEASVSVDANQVLSAIAQADLAAEANENIERRECAISGKVSYFQKNVCETSGKVSMNEVKYCTDAEAFVNASPSEVMSADKEATVIKTSETTTTTKKKACCAGKKKACSAKKEGV